MLNQQRVFIAKNTKILYVSFSSCFALGPIHPFEKKMDDAYTKGLGPIMHTLSL
jgi:hypothetical protein